MKLSTLALAMVTVASSGMMGGAALAEDVTLNLESWRTDDLAIWQQTVIPAFEAKNPGIKVKFVGTAPTEYVAAMEAKLQAGTAGDLVTCRPFDTSLSLFEKGYLVTVNSFQGMDNFSDVAKSAWTTDDGKSTFCVPMASVIHGFIYNKDAFAKVGINEPPKTVSEFFDVLNKIKADGTYTPLAMGTHDQWESATMGYQNIGPNYWGGEDGRLGLIAGSKKLTDGPFVAPLKQLAMWKDYLGSGYEAQTYPDSQNLFTLGKAAIYPSGSWEISGFEKNAAFAMGAFAPPVEKAGDQCYISDHTDIGMGMNAKSAHPKEAQKFLEWVASPEFASLYANAVPGFFSLSNVPVDMKDPLAKEFVSWRKACKSTIRSTYQILSRGTPSLENETWAAASTVINGTATPEEAAKKLQDGLDAWYKPKK